MRNVRYLTVFLSPRMVKGFGFENTDFANDIQNVQNDIQNAKDIQKQDQSCSSILPSL